MTILHQSGKFQLVRVGAKKYLRHCRGYGVWYRIPPRCRALRRAAFATLREVVA
jgi:hypothetical protein